MNRWACFPTKIGSPPKVWHKRRSHPPIYEYHPTIRAFRKQINQASEALAATLAGPLDAFQIRALLARSAFASIRVSNKWLLAENAIRQETSSTFCEHWRIWADSESVLFGLCMMKLWQPLPAQVHPALKLKASSPCHVVTAITCSKNASLAFSRCPQKKTGHLACQCPSLGSSGGRFWGVCVELLLANFIFTTASSLLQSICVTFASACMCTGGASRRGQNPSAEPEASWTKLKTSRAWQRLVFAVFACMFIAWQRHHETNETWNNSKKFEYSKWDRDDPGMAEMFNGHHPAWKSPCLEAPKGRLPQVSTSDCQRRLRHPTRPA